MCLISSLFEVFIIWDNYRTCLQITRYFMFLARVHKLELLKTNLICLLFLFLFRQFTSIIFIISFLFLHLHMKLFIYSSIVSFSCPSSQILSILSSFLTLIRWKIYNANEITKKLKLFSILKSK